MTKDRGESFCRICLNPPKTRSKFISVHNNYRHSKENQTFAELFRQTTGFNIEAREPQFLCTDCRLKLIKSFQFIQQCKKTQENLLSFRASTANHREIKIYYEEEIFPGTADCNETYDQNFGCNDVANEPGELIVEHDVPEATVAPCTPGINEPDEQSSSCSDGRNEIEEPKLSPNAIDSETNAELIVEHVVAENREAPDMRGIEEVSMAEPTISENDLELKENEFVCILGPDPIEDVTASQDLKATDNRFACDQCPKSSCVFETKKKLIAHKYRVHKKTVRCCSCKKYFRLNHFKRHKVFCSLILKNNRTTDSMKRLKRDHLRHKIKSRKSFKKTVKIKRVASKKSNRSSPNSGSCEIEKPIPGIIDTDSPQTQDLVIRLEPMRNGYFCDYCKDNSCFYKSKSALLTHMSTHLQKSPCRFCNEDYTLGEIDTHKAKCKLNPKSKNDLSCKLCKYSSFVFKHKESLHKHITRQHTNVNFVVCTDCGRSFRSDYIKQHTAKCELNPTSENYLKCKHCGHERAFEDEGKLKDHIRTQHKSSVQCTECGKFYDKYYIDIHIESVHNKNKFICDLCPDKSYAVKQSLIDHMNRTHAQNRKLLICKICGEGYKTVDLLKAHRGKMHPELYPLYKCSHCSYKTPIKKAAKLHEIRHLGETGKKHECHTCGKKFVTKNDLKKHSVIHTGLNDRTCRYCNEDYTLSEIDQHTAKCELNPTSENYLKCKHCGHEKTFKNKRQLKKHISLYHKSSVLCTKCGNIFNKYYIDIHIESVHQKNKFICDLCPEKSYTVKQSLIDHMNRTHSKNPKLINCKICGEGYKCKDSLKAHRGKMHSDLYPLYKCSYCSYKTPTKKAAKLHELRHLGETEKKHECHTCGKKFLTKTQSNQHLLSHSDQNSVICDICGQGFKANFYLKRHLHRVHLGEKRFECPVCHKKFQKNQDNRSHIEKHHPEYELPPPGTVLKKNAKVNLSKVTIRVNKLYSGSARY